MLVGGLATGKKVRKVDGSGLSLAGNELRFWNVTSCGSGEKESEQTRQKKGRQGYYLSFLH